MEKGSFKKIHINLAKNNCKHSVSEKNNFHVPAHSLHNVSHRNEFSGGHLYEVNTHLQTYKIGLAVKATTFFTSEPPGRHTAKHP